MVVSISECLLLFFFLHNALQMCMWFNLDTWRVSLSNFYFSHAKGVCMSKCVGTCLCVRICVCACLCASVLGGERGGCIQKPRLGMSRRFMRLYCLQRSSEHVCLQKMTELALFIMYVCQRVVFHTPSSRTPPASQHISEENCIYLSLCLKGISNVPAWHCIVCIQTLFV